MTNVQDAQPSVKFEYPAYKKVNSELFDKSKMLKYGKFRLRTFLLDLSDGSNEVFSHSAVSSDYIELPASKTINDFLPNDKS